MFRISALLPVMLLAACERPFVDVTEPKVVVVSPDLSEVLQQPQLELTVRAGSFRNIDAVSVNGVLMEYAVQERTWSQNLQARRGLNALIIEAADTEGVTSIDTAYALHLPSQHVANSPALPSARGGHTTTRTRDQDLLVIGGTTRVDGPANTTVYILSYPGSGFRASAGRLSQARTGHTATLLRDGRVLVLGGSRTGRIVSVSDLVETPEAYDPSTQSFEKWVVVGEPIRRALHTAIYRQTGSGEYLDLYGGLGDTRYGSSPSLGVRPDLRTFRIGRDTLYAINSLATAPYPGEAIYGHTVNRIQFGPYYVFGGRFESNFHQEASFSIEYSVSNGITVGDIPPLHKTRTRHAAAPLSQTLLLITGGRQHGYTSVVAETEIFSQASETVFRVSQREPILRRFGHTATTVAVGQVLIIGGFGPDGTARAASEFFYVVPGSNHD